MDQDWAKIGPSAGRTQAEHGSRVDHDGSPPAAPLAAPLAALWCPEPDLNRHAMLVAADFKSAVSTDFTIGAWVRSVRPLARGVRCRHVVKTHSSLIGEFFLV